MFSITEATGPAQANPDLRPEQSITAEPSGQPTPTLNLNPEQSITAEPSGQPRATLNLNPEQSITAEPSDPLQEVACQCHADPVAGVDQSGELLLPACLLRGSAGRFRA